MATPLAPADPVVLECPSCHGTRSISGRMGRVSSEFFPDGRASFFGHHPECLVCLDCGRLWHYLSAKALQKLDRGRP